MSGMTLLGFAFESPERLWAVPIAALFLGALGVGLFLHLRRFSRSVFVKEFARREDLLSARLRLASFFSLALAAIMFAIAWAEPRLVQDISTPRYGGVRVTYMVDVSSSMNARDATDGGEVVARMTAAKRVIAGLEKALTADREIAYSYERAMIAFAGTTTTFGGFTTSSEFMHELEIMLSTGMIGKQGSDLVFAFQTYQRLLDDHPGTRQSRDIAIILSDGGNDPGGFTIDIGALHETLDVLRGQITVVAVGFGEDEPATIPELLPDGSPGEPRRRDNGEPWLSAFDADIMRDVAAGSGRCIRLSERSDIRDGRCERVRSTEEVVHEVKRQLGALRTELPPLTERKRAPAEGWFLGIGFLWLVLGLTLERLQRIRLRRVGEKPMREILFEDAAD